MHDLRHAHGEALAEACSDPLIVRDSLNHGSVHVTERYMGKVKLDRIRTAMERRENIAESKIHARRPAENHVVLENITTPNI